MRVKKRGEGREVRQERWKRGKGGELPGKERTWKSQEVEVSRILQLLDIEQTRCGCREEDLL